MTRRGFTIIELIITVTIMGILMVLAVVNVNASQQRARDDERKADIEAIQASLESYFSVGTNGSTVVSRYPATDLVASEANMTTQLRDISIKSLTAPDSSGPLETFRAATNATQTAAGVTPQPDIMQYIYQPLNANGTLCTTPGSECRKYNLYYRLEADSTVYKVTSKNQ